MKDRASLFSQWVFYKKVFENIPSITLKIKLFYLTQPLASAFTLKPYTQISRHKKSPCRGFFIEVQRESSRQTDRRLAGGATFVIGPALTGEVIQLARARGLKIPAP